MSEEKIKTEKEALEEIWNYVKHVDAENKELRKRIESLETKFRYHTELGANPHDI